VLNSFISTQHYHCRPSLFASLPYQQLLVIRTFDALSCFGCCFEPCSVLKSCLTRWYFLASITFGAFFGGIVLFGGFTEFVGFGIHFSDFCFLGLRFEIEAVPFFKFICFDLHFDFTSASRNLQWTFWYSITLSFPSCLDHL